LRIGKGRLLLLPLLVSRALELLDQLVEIYNLQS